MHSTPRKEVGCAIAAVGLAISVAVSLHPEKLNVPAWVAHLAAGAFILGGLEGEYAKYVGSDLHLADLHVISVPQTAPLPQVATAIKRAASLKSSEILAGLRAAPFVLPNVNAAAGISVVRALHAMGVTANLKEVRPRPAG